MITNDVNDMSIEFSLFRSSPSEKDLRHNFLVLLQLPEGSIEISPFAYVSRIQSDQLPGSLSSSRGLFFARALGVNVGASCTCAHGMRVKIFFLCFQWWKTPEASLVMHPFIQHRCSYISLCLGSRVTESGIELAWI